MSIAIMLAFALVAVTFLLHYRALLWLGSRTPRFGLSTQAQVLVIVVALFLIHIVEIGIYAITYGFSVSLLGRHSAAGTHSIYYSHGSSEWVSSDYLVGLIHLFGNGWAVALG